jgi:hypothetical protein
MKSASVQTAFLLRRQILGPRIKELFLGKHQMNEVGDETWRVRANLRIFEASYRFGDTGALRNWMRRKKSLFESHEAMHIYRAWETRLAEMEDFESIHGFGSCLQMNDHAFRSFVSRHQNVYPMEFIERARVANYSVAADFAAASILA